MAALPRSSSSWEAHDHSRSKTAVEGLAHCSFIPLTSRDYVVRKVRWTLTTLADSWASWSGASRSTDHNRLWKLLSVNRSSRNTQLTHLRCYKLSFCAREKQRQIGMCQKDLGKRDRTVSLENALRNKKKTHPKTSEENKTQTLAFFFFLPELLAVNSNSGWPQVSMLLYAGRFLSLPCCNLGSIE